MGKGIRCLAAAALALPLAACGGSTPREHPGQGVVQGVDHEMRQVTIDHDEMPGFMEAMTMTFEVAPGVPLEGIEVGTEVAFRAMEDDGAFVVTSLRPAAP